MLVRPFQLSDYAEIGRLLKDVLSEACYAETMEALMRQLSWDSDLVLVAVKDGNLVGVIVGTIDKNQGYYYRIAVDTNHQRRGVGKALVVGLKQRFLRRGVSRIVVTVDEHNEPILPLYEKAGYNSRDFVRSVRHLRIVSGQ